MRNLGPPEVARLCNRAGENRAARVRDWHRACGSGPSSGAVRSATPPAYPDQGWRAFWLLGNGSSGPAAELLPYGASLASSNSKKPRKLFAPRLLHYIAEAEG